MTEASKNRGRLYRLLGRYARLQFHRLMQFPQPGQGAEPAAALLTAAPADPCLLYLHIPFCPVLCPFCSFHRVRFEEQRARRYFAALRKEIGLLGEHGFRFDQLYVGGGTPTVLPEELAETIAFIGQRHQIRSVSVETNPHDLSAASLARLQAAGVKRLSVGVQSFDDRLLAEMQRLEKFGTGVDIQAHLAAVQGQFETLNVDMMFNFPHQDAASLQRDLDTLTDVLRIDQASFYPLMSTDATQRPLRRAVGDLDHEREWEMYRQISRHMLDNGYRRSSGWCFSRSAGMTDEYISNQDQYLGLGSGSFSYLGGALYANTFSINHYLQRTEAGYSSCVRRRSMSRAEQARYFMLTRLFAGTLDLEAAQLRFEGQFRQLVNKELVGLRLLKIIDDDQNTIRLTEDGQYAWLVLMREFFSGINRFRDQMRHYIADEPKPGLRTSPAEAPAHR